MKELATVLAFFVGNLLVPRVCGEAHCMQKILAFDSALLLVLLAVDKKKRRR